MSIEANRQIVRRYFEEVINQDHVEMISVLFDLSLQPHVREVLTEVRSTFPDLHETIEDMIGEGDTVHGALDL